MKRAERSDWQCIPFSEGSPIPYGATFTTAEFARIQMGAIPRQMEDKWFIYFDEPYLYLHRSWTGRPIYRVEFEALADGARVREVLRSEWTTYKPDPEDQARLLGFLVDNLLLGRGTPFPLADGSTAASAAVEQHVIAGTGYPAAPARRWRRWKFWRR